MTKPPNFAWITTPRLARSVACVIEQIRELQSAREWDRLIMSAPNPETAWETRRLMRDKE